MHKLNADDQKGDIMDKIGWNFSDSFTVLPEYLFSYTEPTAVDNPSWAVINESLVNELNLNINHLRSDHGLAILAGNKIPERTSPIAQAYAGHQFGYFTKLGDGRAILLGEHLTDKGDQIDIQLKGAGKTPYSRGGDGRAALGPMLREYLISEAMHGLRIPTTRSLAVVTTGEQIIREEALPGAILTRVASSHLRVGTFQYVKQFGSIDELRQLADYTIERHFPHIKDVSNCYLAFFKEIVERQAKLIAKWDLVGFVHGVMNTDNMAISGETIDYGPCAFIDKYEPTAVFSSIDEHGRYAYNQQKPVAIWNLARLAEALLPILAEKKEDAVHGAEALLGYFSEMYQKEWLARMKAKLGFFEETEVELQFIEDLLNLMEKYQADYTDTFRALTLDDYGRQEWFKTDEFNEWFQKWQAKLSAQSQSVERIRELMMSYNPAIIPRNFRVEQVLDKAVEEGDYQPFNQFVAVLQNPYAYTDEQVTYAELPPETDQPYQTFCGT
ncbi:protein adenylyltransferase SelO [Amphibacillus sp. Q70]|uniref:protein adenylyltransferase SelO n=1 Tax=Amphibacillus sp. Q70 TaxID=3453416 RepID=UPI003F86BA0A